MASPCSFGRSYVSEPAETLIPREVEYFKWLGRQLTRDGLTLVVLLVPRPVVVYGDLVTPRLPNQVWLAHYRELQERLETEGIAVVSVIEALRREARDGISQHRYVYHLDDTHWNANGISIAADEFLRIFPSSSWPDCRPIRGTRDAAAGVGANPRVKPGQDPGG